MTTPNASNQDVRPDLPYGAWRETCATLHLWTQIVGKVRLALTPWLNHSLAGPALPHRARSDHVADLCRHLIVRDYFRLHRARPRHRDERGYPHAHGDESHDRWRSFTRFAGDASRIEYSRAINDDRHTKSPTRSLSLRIATHRAYDPEYAQRFWRVLVQTDRVLKQFRTGFTGKSSPVHFFWGSFDLAVTRFSGRAAPPHRGGVPGLADAIVREAYSHEVSSAGFWPGGGGVVSRHVLLVCLSGATGLPGICRGTARSFLQRAARRVSSAL